MSIGHAIGWLAVVYLSAGIVLGLLAWWGRR
jgi:hypothetical protein